MELPAISVIIPLYNYEQYIGGCLDSLLAQTFTDFEIIVVDDCSTDNSVAVAESYLPKFNGRLKITRTKKNSGGGGYLPRNIGLNLSRGEYIFFADSDDFMVETALEIMYTAAKNSDADVVDIAAHYYVYPDKRVGLFMDEEGGRVHDAGISDKITLTIDDPETNFDRLLFGYALRTPWTKFVKRDFLIENEIIFPEVISGGDFLWVVQVFCYAKRLLRLPIPLYFYRASSGSVSRNKKNPAEQCVHWISSFVVWAKALGALAGKISFLRKNPAYCQQLLKMHLDYCLRRCGEERLQFNSREIFEVLFHAFDDELLVPFFISLIDENTLGKIKYSMQK